MQRGTNEHLLKGYDILPQIEEIELYVGKHVFVLDTISGTHFMVLNTCMHIPHEN